MKRLLITSISLAAMVGTLAVDPSAAGAHSRPASYAVASETAAGPTPHFPAVDGTTGHVLVSNPAAATVTELVVGSGPVRTFAVGNVPHTVVVDDASRRAFVTNKGSSSVSVVDLTTGGVSQFAVGPNPHGLAIDATYGRLYVTSIDADRLEAYDLETLEPVATVPVGDGPWGVSVGPGRVAVTDTAADTVHILDRASLEVLDVVTVGAGPWNSTFLGGTLFVTLEKPGEVVAVRDGNVVWRSDVGAAPHGIVADGRRGTVLAAVTGSDVVVVLDARTGAVLDTIEVKDAPAGMAIAPSGRVFVGNQGAGVVTELAPQGHR